jgi:hypothetical protein
MDNQIERLSRLFHADPNNRRLGMALSNAYLRIRDVKSSLIIQDNLEKLDDVRDEILDSSARTFFATVWADHQKNVLENSLSEMDIMEVAPETPGYANAFAERYLKEVETFKGYSINVFYALARIEAGEEIDEERFGFLLALSAGGAGSGLWELLSKPLSEVPYSDDLDYEPTEDDVSDDYDDDDDDGVDDFVEAVGDTDVSPGYSNTCEDCANTFETPNEYEEGVFRNHMDCDSCGTTLGGNVVPAHNQEGHHEICLDCVQYHANAELPESWRRNNNS